MTKEFNLSEKIKRHYHEMGFDLYFEPKDVKEFIKLLKEDLEIAIRMFFDGTSERYHQLKEETKRRLNKLAGKELT